MERNGGSSDGSASDGRRTRADDGRQNAIDDRPNVRRRGGDDADDRTSAPSEETTGQLFDALFEHPSSFAAVLDDHGRLLRANEVALSFVGVDEAAVQGEPFPETPWWDGDAVLEPETDIGSLVEAATAGERRTFEGEHVGPDGDRVVVDGYLEPVTGPEGAVERVLVVGRDITERVEASERSQTHNEALQRLYEVMADRDADRQRRIRRLLEVGREYLDLPYGFFAATDAETKRIVAAVGDHPELRSDAEVPLSESYCRRTVAQTDLVALADATEQFAPDDPAVERFGLGCYLGGKVVVEGDLYGTVCFGGDDSRGRPFSEEERTLIRLMAEWLGRELEREHYREDLEAARERLERTFERIDDGFFAVDDEWRVTYANDTGAAVLGEVMTDATADTPAADLLGRHIWKAIPDAEESRFYDRYREALATQQPADFEAYFDPLDAWLSVRAYPSPDGLSVFFEDVTDRRRREETLTGLLRTTREMAAAGTPTDVAQCVVDAAADILDRPLNAVRLHDGGTGRLEVVAISDRTERDLPDRPPYDVGEYPVGAAFERGETIVVDDVAAAGHEVGPVESAMYVPVGDHGVLTLAAVERGAFDDETRRTAELLAANAAAALDRAEREATLQQYQAVVENAREMVYVVDPDGDISMVTEPLSDLLGRDRDDLVGTEAQSLFDEDGATEHATAVDLLEAGYGDSRSFEAACHRADGETVPVEVELSRLSDSVSGGQVGVVKDISSLAAARDQIATQSDRFQHLFEHVPDPVNEVEFVDGEPVIRSVNSAFEETFGYDLADLRGENVDAYIVPPDDREEADDVDRRAREEGVVTTEVTRVTLEGLRTFLFRGVTYEFDGREFGFGIYTDITEQKERQRRLAVLHTVLRHNLRTEMTIMQGHVDELDDSLEGSPAALAGVRDGIESVGELSSKVQDIESVVEDGRRQAIEPTDVVPFVVGGVRAARVTDGAVDLDLSLPDSAVAVADERFELAVRNLVENAVEHHDGDESSVAVDLRTDAEWATVRVADDGPGIPAHERELVSGERDITQLEHGSGLGLWLVNWLVRAYGGRLSFEDNEPEGTVVVVELPRGE